MDMPLLDTLRALNPWLADPARFPADAQRRVPSRWITRRTPGMERWPVRGLAHLVVGARQVGKSSLLWSWLVRQGRPPLFLNCEELLIRSWCRSAARLAFELPQVVSSDTPIFLEEAQHLEEPGLLVKGLIDGGLPNPLLVTGSSAFHLHARTRESLAGRAVRMALHPFSLGELASTLPTLPPLLRKQQLHELCLKHAVQGGYPAVWTGDAPMDTLRRLIEAFVIRDASDLFRIKHVDAFRRLLLLLAGQSGNLVNTSEWASLCGVSRDTIQSYLDILVDSWMVQVLPPFAGGRRAELTGRPKIYLCDTGVQSALLRRELPFEEREDRGPLLESWVAGELRKHLSPLDPMDTLHYWRSSSGAEVDFVLERPGGLLALEVKAAPMREPKLSRSARSFIEAYQPATFVVVNLGLDHEGELGRTRVLWRRPELMADLPPLLEGHAEPLTRR